MTLQIRPQGGGNPYAPDRDIANILPSIIKQALDSLGTDGPDEALNDIINKYDITEEQMTAVAVSLAKFFVAIADSTVPNLKIALERSGFKDVNGPARAVLMSRIGQLIVGLFFECYRESRSFNEKLKTIDQLLETAVEFKFDK